MIQINVPDIKFPYPPKMTKKQKNMLLRHSIFCMTYFHILFKSIYIIYTTIQSTKEIHTLHSTHTFYLYILYIKLYKKGKEKIE